MSRLANNLKPVAIAVVAVAALVGKSLDSLATLWSKAGRAAVETASATPGAIRAGSELAQQEVRAGVALAETAAVAGDAERAVQSGARVSRAGRVIRWVQTADKVATGADVVELLYEALGPEDDASQVPEEVVKSKETVVCRVEPGEKNAPTVVVAATGLKPVRVTVTASAPDAVAREVAGALESAQPPLARRLQSAKSVLLCTRGPTLDTGALLRGKALYDVPRR